MTEDEKDVALTKAAAGVDVAKRSEAKSERSPVQIRSGPPTTKSATFGTIIAQVPEQCKCKGNYLARVMDGEGTIWAQYHSKRS
jgi:hypothetical protein